MEGLDAATLSAKYQQAQQAKTSLNDKEDYSDIIEENEKKRKLQDAKRDDKSKKHKELKQSIERQFPVETIHSSMMICMTAEEIDAINQQKQDNKWQQQGHI